MRARAHKSKPTSLQPFVESAVACRVIASAADLALIVDHEGLVVEVLPGEALNAAPGWFKLVGARWVDTVTKESARKAEQLLREAISDGHTARSRELNQLADGIGEVPFRFSAVRLDDENHVVVMGRDLRPLATVQQRMIQAQQAAEREFGRLRQADTRYRVLFHVTAEGVVVADAASRRVLEANPAAAALLEQPAQAVQGRPLLELFDASSRAKVQDLVASLEGGARPSEVDVRLEGERGAKVRLAPLLFRQGSVSLLLLRFWRAGGAAPQTDARTAQLLAVLDALPEAFVVTGEDRRILTANPAFCELVQQANEKQVIGQPLDRWLGRPGVDLNIMLANLREHGSVRNFSTIIRGEFGAPQEAIATAVSALDGKVPCLGFTIRTVSSRLTALPTSTVLPRSVEQLRELVGRVSLKELVRESADLVERLCIEAALDVSNNNRASAALLLGLSRQGLYSKLRRYGIAEFE